MCDLLSLKCFGNEKRSNRRLANRRANLIDFIEVTCLAWDLCDTVQQATGVTNPELAASIVSAYLETAKDAYCITLRWRPWAALVRWAYREAFLGSTAHRIAA